MAGRNQPPKSETLRFQTLLPKRSGFNQEAAGRLGAFCFCAEGTDAFCAGETCASSRAQEQPVYCVNCLQRALLSFRVPLGPDRPELGVVAAVLFLLGHRPLNVRGFCWKGSGPCGHTTTRQTTPILVTCPLSLVPCRLALVTCRLSPVTSPSLLATCVTSSCGAWRTPTTAPSARGNGTVSGTFSRGGQMDES